MEIGQGTSHGRGDLRLRSAFHLEAESFAAAYHQQIQLSPSVRGPEIALLWPGAEPPDDLFDNEPFPRGADLGMPLQIFYCVCRRPLSAM